MHVETTDQPYTMEYKVAELAPDDVFRITFRLGFRVQQRINLYFRKVVEDLVRNKEVDARHAVLLLHLIRLFIAPEDQYFDLDTSRVKVEKVPLVITPPARSGADAH